MNHADIDALMKGMAPAIRDHVERALASVPGRVQELERRIADLPQSEKGEKGDPGTAGRDGNDGKDGHDGRDGLDGQDADLVAPDDIAESIAHAVKMLAHMPDTKDAPPASQLNIHFPAIAMPELKLPDNVVNVSLPRRGAERVEVTEHSEDGRIKSYVKTPIDEA